jgi:putative phosphotransacetylase
LLRCDTCVSYNGCCAFRILAQGESLNGKGPTVPSRLSPALIDDPAVEGYTMSAGTFVLPGPARARRTHAAGRTQATADDVTLVEEVTRRVREQLAPGRAATSAPEVLFTIQASVSARHIHVTREVLDATYGKGYELKPVKDLSQPGQYASRETLTVVGPRMRCINDVRILGPCRSYTQVELAPTDGRLLGLPTLPIRESGHLDGALPVTLAGPVGSVTLPAAIRATRHLHLSPEEARARGVAANERVRIRVGGEAGILFDNVLIRVHERYRSDLHLDTDDANAAGLVGGEWVEVLRG